MVWSLPVLLGSVLLLAGSLFGEDWLKQRRETSRALPPTGSPNVLFIVLDTVRADHLSLEGYRASDHSHAGATGQEGNSIRSSARDRPMDTTFARQLLHGPLAPRARRAVADSVTTGLPSLAEYLGSRGYATAGFVANTLYCSYDAGLARGFTYYEDYILRRLASLRTAVLVEGILKLMFEIGVNHESDPLHFARDIVERWFYSGIRRDAGSINRGFLDWLARRPEKTRPFFVFLNFIDAHAPYKLPEGAQSSLRSQAPIAR